MRPSSHTDGPAQRPIPTERFELLYREHHAFVWRCAKRMGARDAIVDDAVQETFVVALRRLDEFDPARSAASTWLFGILRNVLRNLARGTRRRGLRGAEYAAAHAHEDCLGTERELARTLLREFLDGLDEERRAVFVLTEIEGLAAKEIAVLLDCNVNTVYTRLRWVRGRFEQHVAPSPALAQARSERPSAETRARNWLGIGAAVGVELPVAVGAGAGVSVWIGLFAKIGAGVVALVLAVLVVDGRSRPEAQASPSSGVAAVTAPGSASLTDFNGTSDFSDPIDPSDPIVVRADRPSVSSQAHLGGRAEPLAEALARLERAAALVDTGDRVAALAMLESGSWPSPSVEGRARVLEVALLCGMERRQRAVGRTREWVELHPDGLVTEQLQRSCGAGATR